MLRVPGCEERLADSGQRHKPCLNNSPSPTQQFIMPLATVINLTIGRYSSSLIFLRDTTRSDRLTH